MNPKQFVTENGDKRIGDFLKVWEQGEADEYVDSSIHLIGIYNAWSACGIDKTIAEIAECGWEYVCALCGKKQEDCAMDCRYIDSQQLTSATARELLNYLMQIK